MTVSISSITGWKIGSCRASVSQLVSLFGQPVRNHGGDGKVPYERIKGKKPTILGIEFGENKSIGIRIGIPRIGDFGAREVATKLVVHGGSVRALLVDAAPRYSRGRV